MDLVPVAGGRRGPLAASSSNRQLRPIAGNTYTCCVLTLLPARVSVAVAFRPQASGNVGSEYVPAPLMNMEVCGG